MKVSTGLFALIPTLSSLVLAQDEPDSKQLFIPGAYIVELPDDLDTDAFLSKLPADAGVDSVSERVRLDSKLFKGTSFNIGVSDGEQEEDVVRRIHDLPGVKNIWPVELITAPRLNLSSTAEDDDVLRLLRRQDSEDGKGYSPHVMTQVDKLHASGITGKGLRIGIVDTGIDYTHPALGGCFGPGCLVEFGYDVVGDDYDGTGPPNPDGDPWEECNGHGTHVAGIIAALENPLGIKGAAPGAKIGMYRAFSCSDRTTGDALMAATVRAYEDGCDIITGSVGRRSGWGQDAFAVLVSRIVDAGVIATFSSGNGAIDGLFSVSSPSSGDGVVSVASIQNTKYPSYNPETGEYSEIVVASELPGLISPFSSWGPTGEVNSKPDVAAPGGNIMSTLPLSQGGYGRASGTSMSCPLVAAIVALLAEARQTSDPALISKLLASTSQPRQMGSRSGPVTYPALGSVAQQGSGLVQAYDAAFSEVFLGQTSLSFNDTDNFISETEFTIENTSNATVVYDIGHRPALTARTFWPDSITKHSTPRLSESFAGLTFDPPQITILPGETGKVSVSVKLPDLPADFAPASLPVYSGFISLNSTSDDISAPSLVLPYLGVAGSLKSTQILRNDRNELTRYGDTFAETLSNGSLFQLPVPGAHPDWAREPVAEDGLVVHAPGVLPAAFVMISLNTLEVRAEIQLVVPSCRSGLPACTDDKIKMQWPWRGDGDDQGSSKKHDSLLPMSNHTPKIPGVSHDTFEKEPPTRPAYHRTTSAQSRSVAEQYSFMTPAETASRLQTSLTHGLPPAGASSRLHDYGPNEIPHDPPEPLWLRFVKQFQEPLIVLLLVSAGASIFLGNTDDAVSITVAVTIVVTVGFVQEYRSEKSIEALSGLVPNHAHLIRGEPKAAQAARPGSWPAGSTNAQVDGAPTDTATAIEEALEVASSKVMAAQLVPGDLVLFTTGDRIPADIRVTKAADLTIDASNLTGENEPVRVTAHARARPVLPAYLGGSSKLEPPSPAGSTVSSNRDGGEDGEHNVAYMGTLVKSGYGQGIVFATGGNTHFGTIATSVSGTESPRSPLQLSMDDLGSQLSKVSFVIIGLISFVGWLQGKKLLEIFQISISLAVAAIPEGLPIIVTVTLALGVHRMAGHHAIVRKMPKVETLGSVNVVCTDKTGTLTMNHMTITKMWCFGSIEAFDVDSDDEATEAKPDAATLRILRIGNIANNGRLARQYTENGAAAQAILSSTQGGDNPSTYTRWTGQPTDVAMLDLLDRFKEHDVRESIGSRVGEVPFSSERKWMGVTIGGEGKSDKDFSYMKGAIDRVLEACDTYLTRDGREVVLDSNRRQEALDAAEEMASHGLRVLAFASGAVRSHKNKPASHGSFSAGSDDNYKGLTFAGLVGMSDPPRPGVGKSIRRLMRGGVKIVMITGDAETTAAAIGRQLGMSVPKAVEHGASQSSIRPVLRGDEIEAMSEEELAQAMQHTSIFARTNPDHKLKIIRAFQSRGDIVAMTGDGVNDAPALKKADIGISMGMHGTDVAKEAADMILTDDDFSTILRAIEEGKGIFNNIQNFLTFQLSTSAASLSLVFFCTLLGHPSPLNAMQILWINIIMDGPPAQSLGVEAVDKDVMNRPPRKRGDAVLTRTVLSRVMSSAAIIMTGTMLVYRHEMLSDGEVTRRDTTMTFTCFVLFDMFNALACRSESKSILRGEIGLFSNVLFNWAVALSLVGQLLVIYFPWLQEVFQTEALGFFDLVRLVLLCSTVFWADEFRKYWKYSRRRLGGGYSQAV
ncbi:hypothetical protein ACHAQA_002839 [Verticillium albo-atrum]